MKHLHLLCASHPLHISTSICLLSLAWQMQTVFAQTVPSVMHEAAPSLATASASLRTTLMQLSHQVWKATAFAYRGLPAATEQM